MYLWTYAFVSTGKGDTCNMLLFLATLYLHIVFTIPYEYRILMDPSCMGIERLSKDKVRRPHWWPCLPLNQNLLQMQKVVVFQETQMTKEPYILDCMLFSYTSQPHMWKWRHKRKVKIGPSILPGLSAISYSSVG